MTTPAGVGPLARLAALLFPKPAISSALDPQAQTALTALNDALADFYNSAVVTQYFSTAETINAEWSPEFKPHHHLHEAIPAGATVLDIGCGSAHPYRHLKDKIGKYYGIDWSEAQVQANRERWPECTFITGSAYAVPLPNDAADVVMSFYVIEHCVWPHRLLDEMLRLARPGGLIVVLTPPFRHKSYLKSLPYGLSARPFKDKLRSASVLDVLWHVYHHRLWYPAFLSRKHPRGAPGQDFLIYHDPIALSMTGWFPDADAVYISDTAEVSDYLHAHGAAPVVHWPEWGYVVARKGQAAAPPTAGDSVRQPQ